LRESNETRLLRWRFNLFPCYFGTGGRVLYIAPDLREVRIKLPLTFRTHNYVGTIFGGSMFGATDPFFMIMLIKCLGSEYTVWDKAASIKFRKPGKSTLFARFVITDQILEEIRRELESQPKLDRIFYVELIDAAGVVHAQVERVVNIRRNGANAA
jgi:acyl-coenzyme A thioesterase PaaI-like protein